jgi:ABC-type multidrug transport system ATPase subunit
MMIILYLFIVFVLFSFVFSQQFPQLTSGCSQSLAPFVSKLDPDGCGPTLSSVLVDPSMVSKCTRGNNNWNCMNPYNVNSAGMNSKAIVPVYKLPASPSQCALCTSWDGMISGCYSLLTASVGAVYGVSPDYSSFGITDPSNIEECDSLVTQSSIQCDNPIDKSSIQILQYQSELLCSSTNTFGKNLSEARNIEGIVDMRAILQCGTCAVIPCLPGQLCQGDGKAGICPEGYYCPLPTKKIVCPKDHFCPSGSTEPRSCRSTATGSCNEGSEREVVWVPLMLALFLITVACCGDTLYFLFSHAFTSASASSSFTSPQHKHQRLSIANDDSISFSSTSSLVSIHFKNIHLITGKTTRIDGVSGIIEPGKFTAILGGSGAGKTSLMNVILGREAATSGEIGYFSSDYSSNNGKIPSKLLDRIVAFVPQNDIYLREMTVYELISHSARWRLPSFYTEEQLNTRIEEVISQLQLNHLRDFAIGGTNAKRGTGTSVPFFFLCFLLSLMSYHFSVLLETSLFCASISLFVVSLSPGDRKKVNIALELVAGPNVLFLDEPTTGIDSSSALNVAKIIRNLAKTGLTCVAVIHQPRTEIFSLIDNMIILQKGGKIAYSGSTKHVMDYFEMYGFVLSNPKANKTDFLIDITSKMPPTEVLSSVVAHDDMIEASPISWADLWDRNGKVSCGCRYCHLCFRVFSIFIGFFFVF